MIPIDDLQAELLAIEFPSGRFEITDWEHWLAADAVLSPPLHEGQAHPMYAYYAAIVGMGPSLDEIFSAAHSSADAGVMFGEASLEFHVPLEIGGVYEVHWPVHLCDTQGVVPTGVHGPGHLRPRPGRRFWPAGCNLNEHVRVSQGARMSAEVRVGTEIPEWVVEAVPQENMKTMALILHDPNPIHWDVDSVKELGLGDRVINQGPTNKAYVINALVAWLGDTSRLRSITVRFRANVYAGDRVIAGGVVTSVREAGGERLADCDVWLRLAEGPDVLSGTATIVV